MKPPIQNRSKLILLLSAVLVFQCCCCIIPFSWGANFESFTLASPFQQESEIRIPARESLKADANEEKKVEGIVTTEIHKELKFSAGEDYQPEKNYEPYR
jgi:hypothetical protein